MQTVPLTYIEAKKITCPVCNLKSTFEGGRCQYCLSERAQPAASADYDLADTTLQRDTGDLIPELLVPRLGDRLVEMGLLSKSNLQHALQIQRAYEKGGKKVLLGQLLVELGFVSRATLDDVVTQQALQLQDALRESNRSLERRVHERTNQLQDALVKLSELSQMKADFVANLSHELRSPLAVMVGFTEMLANQTLGQVSDEQANALSTIAEAGDRLGKLIDDLLQFSEASIGDVPLERAPVSLKVTANRALDQVRELALRKQVTLAIQLPAHVPMVRADAEKISWVIGEFLSNAIKFTPAGGRVEIQAIPGEGRVTVAVSDTGIGMPAERIEEAFQPFHQLDGSITRQFGGSGLGLALARRIIEAHGSAVAVRSVPGKGSQFAFSLPVAGSVPASASQTEKARLT
jgi:signal transduction histidine kinase